VQPVPWYVAYPLIAGAAFAALSYWANRSVYFPSKYPDGLWDEQSRLGAADVWLNTADGVRIHAWQLSHGESLATLFFHGNAGNLTDREPHFREITAAGSSILMLDYRGYGKSAGRPTERGLYADANAAYDYLLKAGYRPGQIVIHGESLGTSVAVDLASRRPCAGLILEAPFTSARDVARTVLPVIGPMVVWGFNSRERIGRVHAPMLFIQGDRDEIIPLRLGQALYAAAPQPKSFWIVPGAGHNDVVEAGGAGYGERLRAFYQTIRSLAK
jgi:fermentation-respiration switch protein FrsA (DUF1100 family)